MPYRKRKKRPPRKLQKIYFWLKRQFELRSISFNIFSSTQKNKLVNKAVSLGKDGMEEYLNKKWGAIPFYKDFRRRKVLKKQPKAIKLLKSIKLT